MNHPTTLKDHPKHAPVWVLAIFWLLFGIKHGAFFDTINFVCMGFIAYEALILRKIRLFDSLLVILVVYSVYSNAAILWRGVWDQWHIFQPWRAIIVYLGVSAVVRAMYRDGWTWRTIIAATNSAIYIHGIIIVATFLFTDLGTAINSITGFVQKSDIRTPGLTNTYAATAFIMSFPIYSHLLVRRSLVPSWISWIGMMLCFVSLFPTARIGLYALPLILLFVSVRLVFERSLRARHVLVAALVMMCVVGAVHLQEKGLFRTNSTGRRNSVTSRLAIFGNETLRHALELYITARKGNTRVKSMETIKRWEFHNSSIVQYLFGTGYFGRGDPLTHLYTDIAYAHLFSMIGIVGVVLLIAFNLLPLLIYPKCSTNLKWVFAAVAITILVSNYKQATLLTRSLFSLWTLLVACMYQDRQVSANMSGRQPFPDTTEQ